MKNSFHDRKILQIEKLQIQFRQQQSTFTAVNEISFSLSGGESLGIVGESGSGKSLTGLSLMGLLPNSRSCFQSGTIRYFPQEGEPLLLTGLSESSWQAIRGKRIAMIFQEPMTSLNPSMKCGRQVREAIMLHESVDKKQARQKVLALFQEVQLPRTESVYQSYPHQLSGGQKQRVMIAMAIACNPDILIADEPTTALDVTVQKTILQLLKTLREKHNMALIFISHDLEVISEIANRVLVMHQGIIVEEGKTEDIFLNPKHEYTKALLDCKPRRDCRPETLKIIAKDSGGIPVLSSVAANQQPIGRDEYHKIIYADEPLLKADQVSKSYVISSSLTGKPKEVLKALEKTTLQIYRGETLGIVGESGSGKTTLGRLLMRLIESDSGRVIYDSQDILSMKPRMLRALRKRIQIIFQDPYSSLNPRMTAGEAIMEPLLVHRLFKTMDQRRERAMELLEKTGLGETHFNRYPHELSGGQRQRLCIARALAVEPEFIICDESVSALDVSVQAQILNLLNDLKREYGLTYIFISHDLAVVKYMSDRIVVMQHGKIVETGEAEQLFSNPQTEYTRTLINSIPGKKIAG